MDLYNGKRGVSMGHRDCLPSTAIISSNFSPADQGYGIVVTICVYYCKLLCHKRAGDSSMLFV